MKPSDGRQASTRNAALVVAAALAALVLAACGSASEGDDSTEPETEGITVYSGRIPGLIGPAIDMHEAEVDRDVQVRFGDSAPLAATIIEEGDNSPADVFFAQDAGSLDALDARGLLAPLPEDILRKVQERFRAKDGDWVGVTGRSRIIAYNRDAVDESDLPDSPLELTGPEWEGRVGWAPSNASFLSFVTALRTEIGEEETREWIEGMLDNDVQSYVSNVPVRDAIASGEIDVGLINHYYVVEAKAEQGPDYPVEIFFPPEDLGSMINVAGVGILASTDRREEAIEFVRFMLSRPAQEYFAESSKEYPLAAGVKPLPQLIPIDQIPSPKLDLSSISDLEGTLDLLRETGAL